MTSSTMWRTKASSIAPPPMATRLKKSAELTSLATAAARHRDRFAPRDGTGHDLVVEALLGLEHLAAHQGGQFLVVVHGRDHADEEGRVLLGEGLTAVVERGQQVAPQRSGVLRRAKSSHLRQRTASTTTSALPAQWR